MVPIDLKYTLNTLRICGGDIYQNAIAISNLVYVNEAPGAVIIGNSESFQDAFLASTLIHHPRNAPILFSKKESIGQNTLMQIANLNPSGVNGIQVYIVGSISVNVENQIKRLGYQIYRITGADYLDTSSKLAQYLNYPSNIILVSAEEYSYGQSVSAWVAHMGGMILFTNKDQLPAITQDIIKSTKNPNVYLMGNTDVISQGVEQQVRNLNVNFIDRITGNSPYEVAVNFAKYKSPVGDFGWGRTDKNGHAFSFSTIENPFNSTSGALLAHLGKHAPMLLVTRNKLPDVVKDYIESVKPTPTPQPYPPFMHGWIIGCDESIAVKTQLEIDKALSIDEGHMGHMEHM